MIFLKLFAFAFAALLLFGLALALDVLFTTKIKRQIPFLWLRLEKAWKTFVALLWIRYEYIRGAILCFLIRYEYTIINALIPILQRRLRKINQYRPLRRKKNRKALV